MEREKEEFTVLSPLQRAGLYHWTCNVNAE